MPKHTMASPPRENMFTSPLKMLSTKCPRAFKFGFFTRGVIEDIYHNRPFAQANPPKVIPATYPGVAPTEARCIFDFGPCWLSSTIAWLGLLPHHLVRYQRRR